MAIRFRTERTRARSGQRIQPVSLGIGESIEAARVLGAKNRLRGVALVRLTTAPVNSHGRWRLVLDRRTRVHCRCLVARRGPREVSHGLFGGVGISHWSGPASVVPFSGAASVLYAAESRASTALWAGLWRGFRDGVTSRNSAPTTHEMQSGGVLRVLVRVP